MATTTVPRPDTPRAAVLIVAVSVDGEYLTARQAQDALHEAADALARTPGGRCLFLHTSPAFPEGLLDG